MIGFVVRLVGSIDVSDVGLAVGSVDGSAVRSIDGSAVGFADGDVV